MDTQSPRFTLSEKDKQTILSIVIHGLVGTILTLISMVLLHINYGDATPIITTILSLISLSLTQYLNGPSAANLRIQELEKQLQAFQASQAANNEIVKDPQQS